MSFLQFPQNSNIAETVLLNAANEGLFRWSIPTDRNITKFALVIKNTSDFPAVFAFKESSGNPGDDLTAIIGIPQPGGRIPLPTPIPLATTTLVAGSAVVLCTGSSTTSGLVVGMPVVGTGVPPGAYITVITDSTHFTISQEATTSGTGVVLNVGGMSSPDAIVVAFQQSTTFDEFEDSFTAISGTSKTLNSGCQTTMYFSTSKRFVQLVSTTVSNAVLVIVGNSTSVITPFSKRNSRGAI